MTTFKYQQAGANPAVVEVDGTDHASAVGALTIKGEAGEPPLVELCIRVRTVTDVNLDGAVVRLDQACSELLLELGWTPPGEKAQIEARAFDRLAGQIERTQPGVVLAPADIAEQIRGCAQAIRAEQTGQPVKEA